MMEEFSEILVELTGGISPLCNVKEIAFHMAKSEQSVYGYRSGSSEPLFADVVRLNHFLIKEKGYYRLAHLMMIPIESTETDGRVVDNLMNVYESGTDLHRAFKASDKSAFCNALASIRQEISII